MVLAATKLFDGAVYQYQGTIIETAEESFLVQTQIGEFRAKRATSCLIEPLVHDTVVVALVDHGRCYVLAVLERKDAGKSTISVPGDMEVKLGNGALSVMAKKGVEFVSGQVFGVTAPKLNVHTQQGTFIGQQISLLAKVADAQLEKAKVFADTIETIAERVTQKVKRAYRFVEDIDQVKAGQISYSAKDNAGVHGKTTLVTASTLVKVDGEQIHIG